MLYLIGRKEISLHILDKKTEEEDFLSKKQYEKARSLNPPSSYDSQNSSILDLDLQSIDPFELSRYNISEDVHNVSLQDNSPYIYKHLQQSEERRRSSPFDISIYDDPLSMDDPSYDYNNIHMLIKANICSPQKKRISKCQSTYCSLPMSIGQYSMNLHFVLFHLVYVHPQIPTGRIGWTIYPRYIVVMICVLLENGE